MIEYKVKVYGNSTEWYLHGKRHREDGAAVELANGDKSWYLHGKRHREDDLPAVEYVSGNKEWWVNGKLHRENGAAIELDNGNKSWWLNGKRHHEDGAAVEYADGDKEWWLNGKEYSEEAFNLKIKELQLKRYFVIRRYNSGTCSDTTDILGLTTDEKYAKSRESVFCGYEEVKMIKCEKNDIREQSKLFIAFAKFAKSYRSSKNVEDAFKAWLNLQ